MLSRTTLAFATVAAGLSSCLIAIAFCLLATAFVAVRHLRSVSTALNYIPAKGFENILALYICTLFELEKAETNSQFRFIQFSLAESKFANMRAGPKNPTSRT